MSMKAKLQWLVGWFGRSPRGLECRSGNRHDHALMTIEPIVLIRVSAECSIIPPGALSCGASSLAVPMTHATLMVVRMRTQGYQPVGVRTRPPSCCRTAD